VRLLKGEEDSRRQAEADARRQAAQEELLQAEADAVRLAQEEEQRLADLDIVRSQAVAEAHLRLEREQQLQAELEELSELETQQLARIREAEAALIDSEEVRERLEAEALARLAEQERQLVELEEIRKNSEAKLQLDAQKAKELEAQIDVLRQAEVDEHRRLAEEEKRLADLDAIRNQVAAEAQQRNDSAAQMNAEIERLRETAARAQAQRDALKEAELESIRVLEIEEERLAELKDILEQTATAAQQRAETARQLQADIETARKAEAKKVKQLEKLEARHAEAEGESRLHAEQEAQLLAELESLRERAELTAQARAEKELNINAQIEALRKAEASQLKRIEKVEAKLRAQEESSRQAGSNTHARNGNSAKSVVKTKAGRGVHQDKSQVALFDALYNETELDLRQRTKKEQELLVKIQALHAAEVEQLTRIEEAKARLRAQQEALRAHAEEEARLQAAESDAVRTTQRVENEFGLIRDDAVSLEPETLQAAEAEEPSAIVSKADPEAEFRVAQIMPLLIETAVEDVVLLNASSEADANVEVELVVDGSDWTGLVPLSPEPVVSRSATERRVKSIDIVRAEKGLAPLEEEESGIPADILKRLNSSESRDRSGALAELSQVGGAEAYRLVNRAFDDQSDDVRNAAAHALYNSRTDRASAFTAALREGSPERRRKIGAALAASGLASDAINNLSGESREKTYDAFSLLFLMAKAGEVQPLMAVIEDHPNTEVRLTVVKLLALSGQAEIVPAFRRLAVRGSLPAEVRSAVMEAIHQITLTREPVKSAA
jgi:hypothetical protein